VIRVVIAPFAPHLAHEPVDRRTGTCRGEPHPVYLGFHLSNPVKRHIYDDHAMIVVDRDVHPTA